MNLLNKDTICAIITPPGNSALGGVRISGSNAYPIAQAIFCPEHANLLHERCLQRGRVRLSFRVYTEAYVVSPAEEYVDGFIYTYIAPHSYTCEDSVEIFIPGSPPLLQALLRSVTQAGCRLAEAGEFTFRAFLNGRISLGAAESVERLIHAQTESQRREAINRLQSGIEYEIASWKKELLLLAGTLETVIDFEDEDIPEDLEFELKDKLLRLAEDTETLAQSCSSQHKPADFSGTRVTLAGLTNSGKSSLLNALLGTASAIISAERSTTRDHTEHQLLIGDLNFIIEDCPGVDLESSVIAHTATCRARDRFQAGDILIILFDSNQNNIPELSGLISHLPPCRAIVVFNKSDLPQLLDKSVILQQLGEHIEVITSLTVSTLTGSGIDELKSAIYAEGMNDSSCSSGVGISTREEEELNYAAKHARLAVEALDMGAELAAIELREAYEALARLGGEGYAEDILENIFSRFCIGK